MGWVKLSDQAQGGQSQGDSLVFIASSPQLRAADLLMDLDCWAEEKQDQGGYEGYREMSSQGARAPDCPLHTLFLREGGGYGL